MKCELIHNPARKKSVLRFNLTVFDRENDLIKQVREQSVSRLILLVTLVVALVPVGFVGFHLHDTAWDNAWREIREKHQLLAQNLAPPLKNYVHDHRDLLEMLADSAGVMAASDATRAQRFLEQSLRKLDGFKTLILLSADGELLAQTPASTTNVGTVNKYSTEKCFLNTRQTGRWSVSSVKPHPVTGKPSIFMAQPVYNEGGKLGGVLLGELQIEMIEQLRQQVRFGQQGHSAIVDQNGHVIAHPNPVWMAEMRDISHWPIVQKMMAGETGVTSFYSPFIKADMVAGYTAVPEIGWGIMVPQPKSEVAAQVNEIMRSNLLWGGIGVLLAILLGLIISRWITGPLNRLAGAGRELMDSDLQGELPDVTGSSPKEIRQLGTTLKALINNLQDSHHQVRELNDGLQQKVDTATRQLRETNERLEHAARVDYLTALANRRYFENSLSRALSRRSSDINNLCILLIDIDHFKQINDYYGHAAGDTVLSYVARMLESQMRSEDMVARYGGDEFVAYMRCEHEIGLERAAQIRESLENCIIPWSGKTIHITASIGLYSKPLGDEIDVNQLLQEADNAMYKAKQRGRNQVVDINHVS